MVKFSKSRNSTEQQQQLVQFGGLRTS